MSAAKGLWHTLTCPVRRRWLRHRIRAPFWADDPVAQMLGVAQYGCRRCGRGMTEQRDRQEADR